MGKSPESAATLLVMAVWETISFSAPAILAVRA
jgi:hypothetical protein